MTERPLLSIIIAAHNCEETIGATFQSILNALGSAIEGSEIIIINDASKDSTADIIAKFADQYSQVSVSAVDYKNVGLVRQHGISLSQGEYITMLDSDDIVKSGSFPAIFSFLRNNRPDMLLSKLHEIRDLTKIDHQWSGLSPEKISQDVAITRFLIHKDLQAHLIGQFIKREIYLNNEIPAMTCYEDFYVFPHMLMAAKNIYFQYDSPYYYIKRQGSLSNSPDRQKLTNLIICTEKMTKLLGNRFYPLVLCHWLDVYLKNANLLQKTDEMDIVRKYIRDTWSFNFLLAPYVRLSYKRKAISLLYRIIKKSL